MRPDDITPEEWHAATDADEAGLGLPRILAAQNALRDERVRAAERERIAGMLDAESKAAGYGAASRFALLVVARRVREGGDTNAQ